MAVARLVDASAPLLAAAPPAAAPAVEKKAEGPKRLFDQHFLDSQSAAFQEHSARTGSLKNHFDTEYLNPILEYMGSLSIDNRYQISTNVTGRSYPGLIALINEKKQLLQQAQVSSGAKSEITTALTELEQSARSHIWNNQRGYVPQFNDPIREAKATIAAAERKKTWDACCIAACLCWIPFENLLTCCNCCWDDGRGHNCRSECTTQSIAGQAGQWSFWAPCTSIGNFCDDRAAQDQVIKREGPVAQRMEL